MDIFTPLSGYLGCSGGMNGLLDMITALEWVKANGARFGGDVSKVTISGESGNKHKQSCGCL